MERKKLVEALSKVNYCTSENKVIPIFSYLSFRNNTIQSFNGSQGILVPLSIELDGAIKSDIFTKLVNSYSSENIGILDYTDKVVIKAEKSKNTIAMLDNSEFLSPFETDKKEKIRIPFTKELYTGIKKCYTSISKIAVKEEQNGVVLKTLDKKLNVYSTDGNRISKYETGIDVKNKIEILLPEKFCKLLISLYEEDGEFVIYDSCVVAEFTSCKVFSNFNTGIKIYDFESVLNKYEVDDTFFQKLPEELTEAIKRSNIILEGEKEKILNFNIENGSFIKLTAKSSTSEMEEDVWLKEKSTTVPLLKFDIDAELLNSSIKEIEEIGFKQAGRDCIVGGKSENYLIMIGSI